MAVTPETLRTFHETYQSYRDLQRVANEFMDLVMNQSEELLSPNLPHESISPQHLWMIRNAFMIVVDEWRKRRKRADGERDTLDEIASGLMLHTDTVFMSAEEYATLNGIVELTMRRFPDGLPPREYDDEDDDDDACKLHERVGEMIRDIDAFPVIDTSRGARAPGPQDDVTGWSMLVSFAFAIGVVVGMWIRS